MNDKLQKLLGNFVPFIVVGVAITLCIGLLFLFFYIAVWGLLIGATLWAFAWAKQYLFPPKSHKKENITKEKGRVIEHDEK